MVVFGENAEEMVEIEGWAGWIFVVHLLLYHPNMSGNLPCRNGTRNKISCLPFHNQNFISNLYSMAPLSL